MPHSAIPAQKLDTWINCGAGIAALHPLDGQLQHLDIGRCHRVAGAALPQLAQVLTATFDLKLHLASRPGRQVLAVSLRTG